MNSCLFFFLSLTAILLTDFKGYTSSTSSFFALANDNPERTCKDKRKHTIRRKKKTYEICEWVALKPEARCKSKRKIKKVKNKKGKIVKGLKVDPVFYCGCTCADVSDSNPRDNCPVTTNPVNDVHQTPCSDYAKGKVCNYDWAWTGCTYEELSCDPITVCTCGEDSFRALLQRQALIDLDDRPPIDDWLCLVMGESTCPRGGDTPPESGKPCQKDDPKPTPQSLA